MARDGVEALDYIFARGVHAGRDPRDAPAVILLDLKLPRIDGLEVLKQVRADPKVQRIPIVILTSSAQDRDRIESYNLGANSYVQKPVAFEDFSEAVRQVGLYWLVLNQPPPRIN
jgi:CheY-like chemotaxis protein